MAWKNVQYENGKFKTGEGGGGGGTVTDVTVDGTSVVNQQGVAELGTPNASEIEYDNQQSGLSATDVQGAIDELAQGSGSGGVEDVEVNGTSVVNAQNVAQIKSYKEVTQAEYNALPASKTSDGILYCIKDVGGADGFPPLIYSLEEREVGVWTDGKPLYEVTKIYNNLHIRGTEQLLDSGLLSVDSFVGATGSWIRSDGTCDNLPSSHTNGNFCVTANDFDKTTGKINLVVGSFNNYFYLESCIITFKYTKTTDTSGSGTWTTQGGYAHHYSTDEHIIGTWIDGKPLYEKTLKIINNIDFSTGVEIATGISNPEFVKIAEGYFYDGPNDGIGTLPYNQGVSSIGAWFYLPIYKQSTNKIVLKTNDTFSANNARYLIIVLQYTKTTD